MGSGWYHGVGALEFVLVALRVGEVVGGGVEGEAAGERHGGNQLGRGQEVMRVRVAVVARGEVAVERGEDAVLLALGVAALPLADARTARVRQHQASNVPQRLHLAVALNSGPDLFRTWKQTSVSPKRTHDTTHATRNKGVPGVTVKTLCALVPFSLAWRAMAAARDMSS